MVRRKHSAQSRDSYIIYCIPRAPSLKYSLLLTRERSPRAGCAYCRVLSSTRKRFHLHGVSFRTNKRRGLARRALCSAPRDGFGLPAAVFGRDLDRLRGRPSGDRSLFPPVFPLLWLTYRRRAPFGWLFVEWRIRQSVSTACPVGLARRVWHAGPDEMKDRTNRKSRGRKGMARYERSKRTRRNQHTEP